MFFFAVHGLYIFVLPTPCLRLAYAVAVFSYAGTICLDLPTRAYAYQLFSDFAYAACVCCFCGLSVGLNSSHFAYAVGASVVSWGCVFCTSGYCYTRLQTKHIQIKMQGCETPRLISQQQNTTSNITTKHFLQHRLRRKKYQPTSSKCLRQAYAGKRNAYASTSQDILCINWIFLLKNAAQVDCIVPSSQPHMITNRQNPRPWVVPNRRHRVCHGAWLLTKPGSHPPNTPVDGRIPKQPPFGWW